MTFVFLWDVGQCTNPGKYPHAQRADEETAGLLGGVGAAGPTFWEDVMTTWALSWPIFGTFILQVGCVACVRPNQRLLKHAMRPS